MKLLYLSSSTLISDSANSVHVMRMCDCFHENGQDVTLLGYRGQGGVDETHAYYGTRSNFKIERTLIEDNNFARILLTLRRRIPFVKVGPLPSLLHAKTHVLPLVENLNPDLVLSRNLDWLWAGVPKDVAFLFEAHGLMQSFLQKYMFQEVIKRPSFKGLIVISQALKKFYLRDFPQLNSEEILVLHDAADLPEGKTYAEKKPQRPIIGYVGHLYEGRGAENIIEMAKNVPQADFHFVGGRAEDISRLSKVGVPENVTFFGHVAPSELADYYRSFDIVLAPYQKKVAISGGAGDTSAFMSPLKIFEYMAWEKLIICSDMPVLREILKDGVNSILLPADDVAAWSQNLSQLIEDKNKRQRLAAQARLDVEKDYTWRKRAGKVIEFIQ